MIRFDQVDLAVAGHPLLSEVTWHLTPGRHVGLLGRNGAGKTTLLRAMVGAHPPESGQVHVRGGIDIGWLQQHGVAGTARPLWDEARSGMKRLIRLRTELESAEARVSRGDPGALEAQERALEAFRVAGGFSEDATIGGVLHGLGFDASDWKRPCNTFSGGWQMRIALARLLLASPDVLLLDEPTNHLDLHARGWLADYLCRSSAALVVVSHDRYLLDRVAHEIVELRHGGLRAWPGNFSAFLRQKAEATDTQSASHAKQQREIAKLERFVDRFKAKASKAAQARSKQKALDRMERIDAPLADRKSARLVLPEPDDCEFEVLKLQAADVGWPGEAPVLTGVDLVLERGSRWAALGPNGCGKTTLLKALAGKLRPLRGRYRRAEHARIGVFDQDVAAALPPAATPLQHVSGLVPRLETQKVRAVLGALGLSGDAALRPIGTLSGGERARVALAALAIRPHNALLLDEPTNHLDIQTVDVLCTALSRYVGTLFVVSHDRHLVQAVATHVVRVQDRRIEVHEGVRASDFDPVAATRRTPTTTASDGSHEVRKRRNAQRRKLTRAIERLEAELPRAEARIAALDERLYAEAADHVVAAALSRERDLASQALDAMYSDWEAAETELADLDSASET